MSNNQLFLAWLLEWQQQSESLGTKSAHAFRRAHDSLKACPVAFAHPKEMLNLKGFGPGICGKLEKKLAEYCAANDISMPTYGQAVTGANENERNENERATKPSTRPEDGKKKRTPKQYVPQYRTGAYAILLILHEHNETSSDELSKTEIIRRAQPLCDASFETGASAATNAHYTAWAGMKMLLKHELVIETGKRPRLAYQISQLGIEIAQNMLQAEASKASQASQASQRDDRPPLDRQRKEVRPARQESSSYMASIRSQLPPVQTGSKLPQFVPEIWPAGSFTVKIVLDNREVQSQKDRDFFSTKLSDVHGISADVRALGLGDTVWVAKHKATGTEVMLEHIAERKRIDDLISSLKDGRFHEQKYRLMRSGLRSVIYIVEEAPGVDIGNFFDAIQTAISTTQVVNGFFLRRSSGVEDTVGYLARLTRKIAEIYEAKALHVIPDDAVDSRSYLPLMMHLHATDPTTSYHISYPKFQAVASKSGNLTVRDVFLRMLLTIRGVSWEKALEIQKQFPTPRDLWLQLDREYTENGDAAARSLITSRCGVESAVSRKRIGPALSSRIAEIWGPVDKRTGDSD